MTTKTYNPVNSDHKVIDIVEYLHQQTGPVSGSQIAKALGMPIPTVMSHMVVLLQRKWVNAQNGLYEPGLRLAGMYSAYKMGLIGQRDEIERKIAVLEA